MEVALPNGLVSHIQEEYLLAGLLPMVEQFQKAL